MIEARISAGARRLGLEVASSSKNCYRIIDVPSTSNGLASLPMFGNGSSFSPERGLRAWRPLLDGGVDVVSGGGLPNRHHVSSFVVWQEVDTDDIVLPAPPSPDGLEKVVHQLNKRVASLEDQLNERVVSLEEQMQSIADWLLAAPVE